MAVLPKALAFAVKKSLFNIIPVVQKVDTVEYVHPYR
jgi:hypothetical protein